jgi:hypothetical protein
MMYSLLVRGNLVGSLLGLKLGVCIGGSSGLESIAKGLEDSGGLGFVERRPWRVCLMCPVMVESKEGQRFIALQRIRSGKVALFLALMAANQMDGTGLPAEAWWIQTTALMLGRSYALLA